jgi:hypothetical protein
MAVRAAVVDDSMVAAAFWIASSVAWVACRDAWAVRSPTSVTSASTVRALPESARQSDRHDEVADAQRLRPSTFGIADQWVAEQGRWAEDHADVRTDGRS